MQNPPSEQQNSSAEGLEALIRATMVKMKSGEQVDFDAIEQELDGADDDDLDRLCAFRALLSASRRASSSSEFASGSMSAGSIDHAEEWEDDPQEDVELLRQSLDGYHVIERIDRGGQGAIYLAEQKSTKRLVAIKVLLDGPLATEQQKQRFQREVRLSSHLQHPNIVAIYDSGTVRGRHYLAMEYVEGIPIDGFVELHRPSVKDCVRMFLKVCRAVSHAHQRGVIHRDIKPSNILVDMDGEPHILDFGFAKARDVMWSDDDAPISASHQAVGTLQYMSPERVLCVEDGSDVRSDVYALGMVLYQIISRRLPFPLDVDRENMRKAITQGRLVPLRRLVDHLEPDQRATIGTVSEDLNQIILKTLAREKEGRYQSADALARDLECYLKDEPVQARADNKRYMFWATIRRYRKHIIVAGAFVLLLVIGLIGALIMWRQNAQNARMWQAGLTMGSYVHLGGVERDEGRVDEAIDMFEQAIRIAQNSPVLDGQMLRRLLSAHHQVGLLYVDQGKDELAMHHAAAMIKLTDQLREVEPDAAEVEMWPAHVASLRAYIATRHERWQEALDESDAARAILQGLIEKTDDDWGLRQSLASVEERRAICLRNLGRPEKAKLALNARLKLTREALKQRPDSLDAQMSMIYATFNLAVFEMQTKTPQGLEEALRLFEEIEQRIQDLVESGRGATRQRDINQISAAVVRNMGIVKKRLGAAETEPTPDPLPQAP